MNVCTRLIHESWSGFPHINPDKLSDVREVSRETYVKRIRKGYVLFSEDFIDICVLLVRFSASRRQSQTCVVHDFHIPEEPHRKCARKWFTHRKKKYLRFLERERLLWPSSHEMFSFLPLELLLEYSLFRSLVSSYSGFHNQSRYSIYFWSILFNSLHFDPLCVWIYCPR